MYPIYFRDIMFGRVNSQQESLHLSPSLPISYSTNSLSMSSLSIPYYNQVLSNYPASISPYNPTTLQNHRGNTERNVKRIYQSVELYWINLIFRQYRKRPFQLLFQLHKRKQVNCIYLHYIIRNRYRNNPMNTLKESIQEGKKVIQFKPYNSETMKIMEEFGLKPFFEVRSKK